MGARALRTIAVLTKTLAARRVGALLAKLLVGKAARRTRFAAIATRRTLITIEPRAFATGSLAARRKGTFLATALARTEILARAPVRAFALAIRSIPATRRTVVTIEPGGTRRVAVTPAGCIAVALSCVGALLAVAPVGLVRKAALGELLLRTAWLARAAILAARRPVAAPARGCIVFVFVAGHE